METSRRDILLDRLFYVALILKGLDGVLELVGGVMLLVVTPDQINSFVTWITQHELSEDPNDLIANALVNLAGSLDVSATTFAAAYLLVHGIVKVLLVGAVLAHRLWAYPWLIAFLVVFIAYQIYQMAIGFTWGMLALTVFDVVIVALTWRENGQHKAKRARGEGVAR